jgi:hypothetical protein
MDAIRRWGPFLWLLVAVLLTPPLLCAGEARPARPSEAETAAAVDDALLRGLSAGARPPTVVDDETFLRRVSLDLTGRLPDPDTPRRRVADNTRPTGEGRRGTAPERGLRGQLGRYCRDTVTTTRLPAATTSAGNS